MSKLKHSKRVRNAGFLAFIALLVLVLSSCGELFGGDGPIISEFEANPSRVQAGETVLLSWQVEGVDDGNLTLHARESGASTVALGDVTERSSYALQPANTTTYRLSAANGSGKASRETSVTVADTGSPPDEGPDVPEETEPPEIGSFISSDDEVPAGEDVLLSWETSSAQRVELDPPGVEVSTSGSMVVQPFVTTTYVLSASNGSESTRAEVTVSVTGGEDADRILLVIAGQSNASGSGLEDGGEFPTDETEQPQEGVRMLTPDRQWIDAAEPTHPGYEHSFGLRLGKEVRTATGADVFLVPVAEGGTALSSWQPGDANYEDAVSQAGYASESLGIPVSAVIWFQGESDTKYSSRRNNFTENTDNVLAGFNQDMPGGPDVIFVQLSKRLFHGEVPDDNLEGHNLAYQELREKQRLMESGAKSLQVGSSNPEDSDHDRGYYHMVVSHDLPMSDIKHVSADGQRYLGRRIANTFLDRVYTGSVSGTVGMGPRLERVTMTADRQTVLVDTTATVNESDEYDGYFTVFVDGEARSPATIRRDPGDDTRIELSFSSPLSGTVEVRYMPPDGTSLYQWSGQAVHTTVDGLILPLPAFGGPVEPYPHDSFPGLILSD